MNLDILEVKSNGRLKYRNKVYACALGRGGVGIDKQEGYGKTPLGTFPLRLVYFRPDKIQSLKTKLPMEPLEPDLGWSDDVSRPEYNKEIKLPYEGSYENLWRDDDMYDVVVVIGYNDSPPVPGKGSAIFLHVARPGFTPTEGCVALSKSDLLEILASCN